MHEADLELRTKAKNISLTPISEREAEDSLDFIRKFTTALDQFIQQSLSQAKKDGRPKKLKLEEF